MHVPHPDSDDHRKLVRLVTRNMRTSENNMSTRHTEWRRAERTYRLYVDPSETQEPRNAITEESQLLYPYPTSIVVPLSYALTQTVVAFWISLFTAEMPYFRINAHDPESEGAARAQELLLQHQFDHIGYVPFLYYWFLDACRYGTGVVKNAWDTKHHTQTVRRFLDLPGPDGPIRVQVKEKKNVLEYEGNYPEIIDPFQWRPDVRWPLNQFQRGSYCGEAVYRSHNELLEKEKDDIYEHVKEIKKFSTEHFKESQSDRERIMDTNTYFGLSFEDDEGLVLIEELAKDLRPRQFGLGESDDLERWLIVLANKSVIIRAEPFPYDHNDYPYALAETSPDYHSLTNPGLIEIMEPIHQHITWFTNSILEDARKTLNDRLVVDPSIINMDDLLTPSAGKFIRVNEDFWGVPSAVKNGLQQLKVEQVSALNFQQIGFLTDLLQQTSAANETMQGQIQSEERTATEISSATQMGAQRLRVMARFLSTTGVTPLVKQMVQNNMQLMTQEQYFKITGSLDQSEFQGIGRAVNGGGMMIAPEDIQGMFSFPVSDASSPLDPVRFARTWVQVMQISTQNPALEGIVNHPAVWMEMVKSMGIRDPARFLIPQQTIMPDEQIAQQEQAGNLVPQQANTNGATPPPRTPIPYEVQGQTVEGQENRPQG